MTDKQIVEIILPLTIFEIVIAVLTALVLYDFICFLFDKLKSSSDNDKA